jgi:hypothetical protein
MCGCTSAESRATRSHAVPISFASLDDELLLHDGIARAEQRRGCGYYSLIEQPRILRLKENLVDILFKRKLLMH